MEELELLQSIGLTKNASKVYLSLLQKERSSVSEVATMSGVHRVNVYDALAQLKAKGLATESESSAVKRFSAQPPEKLQQILLKQQEDLGNLIPRLMRKYVAAENKARSSEGLDAIKDILEDILVIGKPVRAFGIPKNMPDLIGGYLLSFHRRRIEKKIPIWHIYNENAKERIKYLNELEMSEAKHLPPEFSVPATTVVYGDKVAFWIWSQVPFCVQIESEKMALAYEKYFEILWDIAAK